MADFDQFYAQMLYTNQIQNDRCENRPFPLKKCMIFRLNVQNHASRGLNPITVLPLNVSN